MHHLRALIKWSITPLHAYMQAWMLRAAHATCSQFDVLYFPLVRAAHDCLSLLSICRLSLSPPGWDSPAFVENLHSALRLRLLPCNLHKDIEVCISKWLRKLAFPCNHISLPLLDLTLVPMFIGGSLLFVKGMMATLRMLWLTASLRFTL